MSAFSGHWPKLLPTSLPSPLQGKAHGIAMETAPLPAPLPHMESQPLHPQAWREKAISFRRPTIKSSPFTED